MFGNLLVLVGLLLLFVEIVEPIRINNASVVDHILSTFVFVVFMIEFLLVRGAVHPVFSTLIVISLLDVLANFSVSLRATSRDVSFGRK